MLVPAGPIAFARKGWGLKGGVITSVIAENSEGKPEVLCAQMVCAAAISGVKVLVLLPGGRENDLAWQAIGDLLGGGNGRTAADNLGMINLRMFASGTGKEHVSKAGLVYAPGLRMDGLEEISSSTEAPVLTLSTDYDSIPGKLEVIRVGGDFINLDAEGAEIPVTYDESGPTYCPVPPPLDPEGAESTT